MAQRFAVPWGAIALGLLAFFGNASPAWAQVPGDAKPVSTVYRLRIHLRVEAADAALSRISARCPVPVDWPEQKVKLISETLPKGSKSREQSVKNMGAVWIVECPTLPAGKSLEAERVYELSRTPVVIALAGKTWKRPEKLTAELRGHLQDSPGIETKDSVLKMLAAELAKPKPGPMEFTEAAREWIGKNVSYEMGSYKGAKWAYDQRKGDCEDLSALLIALCRIQGIPARTVWVEGHAYPEFFLEDQRGEGHWIPVELPGSTAIGTIRETRPILQKGDQYRDTVMKQRVRYLPQQAIAFGGRAKLAVTRTILEGQTIP